MSVVSLGFGSLSGCLRAGIVARVTPHLPLRPPSVVGSGIVASIVEGHCVPTGSHRVPGSVTGRVALGCSNEFAVQRDVALRDALEGVGFAIVVHLRGELLLFLQCSLESLDCLLPVVEEHDASPLAR